MSLGREAISGMAVSAREETNMRIRPGRRIVARPGSAVIAKKP